MGNVFNYLIEHYEYFIFAAILLVMALIGYIVDSRKSNQLKQELEKKKEEEIKQAPIPIISGNTPVATEEIKPQVIANNGETNTRVPIAVRSSASLMKEEDNEGGIA